MGIAAPAVYSTPAIASYTSAIAAPAIASYTSAIATPAISSVHAIGKREADAEPAWGRWANAGWGRRSGSWVGRTTWGLGKREAEAEPAWGRWSGNSWGASWGRRSWGWGKGRW